MFPFFHSDFLVSVLARECDALLHEIVQEATGGGHPYRAVRRVSRVIANAPFLFVYREFSGE